MGLFNRRNQNINVKFKYLNEISENSIKLGLGIRKVKAFFFVMSLLEEEKREDEEEETELKSWHPND